MTNSKNTPKKWLATIAALGMLTFALSSCVKDNNTYYNPPVAYLAFIQGSPGQPQLNFSLNNDLVNNWPLSFGDNISYINAYAGSRTANFNNAQTGGQVYTEPIQLTQNQSYTLALADTGSNTQGILITDTINQPASGKANVRFINLGTDAPACDLIIKGGAAIASDKAFKGYSSFVPVAAGSSYDLEVVQSGTGTVIASLPNTILSAGFVYTISLQGLINTTVTGEKAGINIMTNAGTNYLWGAARTAAKTTTAK
jgi:hypothetical protein